MADELEHGELVERAEPATQRTPAEAPAMVAARRAHAAYHDGVSKFDTRVLAARAYVEARGEQWERLTRFQRGLLIRLVAGIVERSHGERFCSPTARYPICDERPKPASPV